MEHGGFIFQPSLDDGGFVLGIDSDPTLSKGYGDVFGEAFAEMGDMMTDEGHDGDDVHMSATGCIGTDPVV